MKSFKRFFMILILFICYVFICANSYANTISKDLSASVFRLHILANSDSEEDQNLKLLVRDNILKYMKEISNGVTSKEYVEVLMETHLNDFYDIARKTILDNGYDYDVKLKIGKFDFPTKVYGDISLPAGMYDALRIEIGKAEGHNWWCVMFPTLCFVDVSSGSLDDESKEVLESNLDEEEFNLVTQDNFMVSLKFKIVEFFEDMKVNLASK